jgi:hypothetical protein
MSGTTSVISGYCDPEYLDSSPESPGNYYSSESFSETGVSGPLYPEYPDIYPEYPGILLVAASFCERGYKYPPYPFIYFSLAHFETEQASKQKESPLTSPLPFLSDFLRGIK